MYRRGLLRAAAVAPVAALLACQPPAVASSQLTSDVGLLVSGLAAAIANIRQTPGVPGPAVTHLEANLSKLQADARIVTTATGTPAPSAIQEIEHLVEAVASIALPLIPGGSAIQLTIEAAVAILPPILAAAGISGIAKAPKFTPAQARVILAAAH